MQSQYSVDGSQPQTFIPPSEVTQESYGQKFFDSGPLAQGDHTLTITNLGEQLWIDYFQTDDVTPIQIASPSATSLSSSTSIALLSSSTTNQAKSLSSTSASHTSTGSSSASKTTESAISTSDPVLAPVSSAQSNVSSSTALSSTAAFTPSSTLTSPGLTP